MIWSAEYSTFVRSTASASPAMDSVATVRTRHNRNLVNMKSLSLDVEWMANLSYAASANSRTYIGR